MIRLFSAIVLGLLLAVSPVAAQSQAANGSIEGTVSDTSGGVLPGVTVTITNTDNGSERVGRHERRRAVPCAAAAARQLSCRRRAAGIQAVRADRTSASRLAQTVVVNPSLEVGAVNETITVSADQMPALDLARIDIGHTMSDLEVHSLPLVARNPYNFALVAAGRHRLRERRVRRAASRRQRRGDAHQLPDRRQHEHREGPRRSAPAADVGSDDPGSQGRHDRLRARVRPDDGHGLQRRDAVGHQRLPRPGAATCSAATRSARSRSSSAAAARRRQRTARRSRPRRSGRRRRSTPGTASLGGPIVKNKLFFYGGWEQTRRDLSANSLITVSADVVSQLGLKTQPSAAPNVQTAKFAIGKVDYQLNGANRLTARWIRFHNDAPYNAAPAAARRSSAQTDFLDAHGLDRRPSWSRRSARTG